MAWKEMIAGPPAPHRNTSEVIFTADASGWIKPNMSVREIVELKRKKRLADG